MSADAATSVRAAGEIDIVGGATIAYSSEDPAHPIEHALDGTAAREPRAGSARAPIPSSALLSNLTGRRRSRGSRTRWKKNARAHPASPAEVSEDGGRTYRQIFVQEYTFSPRGATYQREEQRFNRVQASHLRLTIVPNKNGSGSATLTALRVFA